MFLSVGRAAISVSLCFSGILHLNNPYAFYISVLNYGYLDPGIAPGYLSAIVPLVQVVVGVCVVLQPPFRSATIAAACMFGVFFFAQIGAALRGLPIDCGCFGSFSHPVGFESISIVGLLWIISLGCILLQHCRSGEMGS